MTIAPDDERVLLGVAGFQARAALANLFSELPDSEKPVTREGATTLLWFEHPVERFLLITDVTTAETVTEKLRGEAELNNSQQWLALDIEAGLPVIDSANSAQFIPQATNLQALGGSVLRKAVIPGRRWWREQNSAGRTNVHCGLWRVKPVVYQKRGTILRCKWARTGVVLALFSRQCNWMMVSYWYR